MAYTVTRITDPDTEPVTVAEVKGQARIDLADEDTLIAGNITAARMALEDHLARSLFLQESKLTLDCFPEENYIQLPRSPLSSVESVNYIDTDGVAQVMSSGYSIDTNSEPGAIFLDSGESWPATAVRPGAVWVQFIAGYHASDADKVPQPIRNWIKAVAALADDLREVDVLALMPVTHLNTYKKPMRQRFKGLL